MYRSNPFQSGTGIRQPCDFVCKSCFTSLYFIIIIIQNPKPLTQSKHSFLTPSTSISPIFKFQHHYLCPSYTTKHPRHMFYSMIVLSFYKKQHQICNILDLKGNRPLRDKKRREKKPSKKISEAEISPLEHQRSLRRAPFLLSAVLTYTRNIFPLKDFLRRGRSCDLVTMFGCVVHPRCHTTPHSLKPRFRRYNRLIQIHSVLGEPCSRECSLHKQRGRIELQQHDFRQAPSLNSWL